jgi:hypothetical protein
MAGWFWPDTAYGLPGFLLLTFLGAAAAFATGRAIASVWSPLWRIVPAIIPLAAGVRFLHFALFQEKLLSLHYYLVTFALLLAVALYSYQSTRAWQMAKQYPWAFTRFGLGWRAR